MATVELTKDLLAEIGGWAALKEARGLVERGRVSDARREGDVIRARVQGGEKVHEPSITLAERVANVEVKCTCLEYRKQTGLSAHPRGGTGVFAAEGGRCRDRTGARARAGYL